MYHLFESRVREALAAHIQKQYGQEIRVVAERPPKIAMGEVATPVCFELAKRLKRAPRQIAQEVVGAIGPVEGVARFEVAGGGYINAYLDRAAFFLEVQAQAGQEAQAAPENAPKNIVEHTNINPNKAAHIGHLRNAALGDTLVRLLRHSGQPVEVQNYIDNTGVQVADVVVGFMHLEKKTADAIRRMAAEPRFDYICWDLYARVTQFYEEDKSRNELRGETLKAIEHGTGAAAEIGAIVSTAIVRCHLRTMERLGIEYDVLPQESEVLHLKFWDTAFELLKKSGAIVLAPEGKNKGCWVMPLGSARDKPLGEGTEQESAEEDAKIIVRSNGTVTYVGKDIAYHLWKFGVLGRDFHYARFHTHPSGHVVWGTRSDAGEPGAPAFGHGAQVYNVIDTRQSYLQDIVVEGLKALGFTGQAARFNHFAYEIVALTPRCAAELGYELSDEDARKPYVEVSGRKGLGVKADDLMDRLEDSARAEVDARHADTPESERTAIAHAIAIGALRYFLLRFTRNTKIAFDFKDALSFEGETGPYCQYAVVRILNIFRKWLESKGTARPADIFGRFGADFPVVPGESAAKYLDGAAADDLWEMVLLSGSLGTSVNAAIAQQEPAFIAKYAFQLAQAFNLFYHKHHILSEEDEARKMFLLALSGLVLRQLMVALDLLGIETPPKM